MRRIILAFFLLQTVFSFSSVVLTSLKQRSRCQKRYMISASLPAPSLDKLLLRGGFTMTATVSNTLNYIKCSPTSMFNGLFVALLGLTAVLKGVDKLAQSKDKDGSTGMKMKPESVKDLQRRFLTVFWLVRMADWLQGPYFYEVYASKILNGVPASMGIVSKLFLVGFATTGVLGPFVGRQVDVYGRRAGTIAFSVLYALGALSTRANVLWLLLLGRIAGGIGTSLLFSAPEAWMVAEHQNLGHDEKWIGDTFGLAYGGDAIVAIIAGQLASMAATRAGPTGPYTFSLAFLTASAILAATLWTENKAKLSRDDKAVTIKEGLNVIAGDHKIQLLGAIQALFEGAMYIFVIQWVPALKAAAQTFPFLEQGAAATIPFGKVFSCFMASCLLGTTVFSKSLTSGASVEGVTLLMLAIATTALTACTTIGFSSLPMMIASFFVFEACVGMYFPSIGTLRSKYIPDAQRSVIMNIFGLPLNLIVVSVFLLLQRLGMKGALSVASAALGIATLCMAAMKIVLKKEQHQRDK